MKELPLKLGSLELVNESLNLESTSLGSAQTSKVSSQDEAGVFSLTRMTLSRNKQEWNTEGGGGNH